MKNRRWRVAVLPGDGVGPELMKASLPVLERAADLFGIRIDTDIGEAGLECIGKYKTNLPEKTAKLLRSSDCVLKGPMTTPEGKDSEVSAAVKIRKMFRLYANVRPCKSIDGIDSIGKGTDLVIVRENTEGLYSGIDAMVSDNMAIGFRIITRKASRDIGTYALSLAMKRKRHLTIVHKANILKNTDNLFKGEILSAAKKYPMVRVDEAHVDAMSQWLIKNPGSYDVIVTENMFGDILSDEAAMIVGGIGTCPSANIGKSFAMFEPVHGSAPKYAGMDKVNPIATILSIKMMLDWMGFGDAAKAVEKAVQYSIYRKIKTYDIGGNSKTSEVGRFIERELKRH